MSDINTLVGMLKAAGENTRMRLLVLLADGELSVKSLTEILEQSQPRVSRHLKLLVEAGLIERNAEGAWAYFGLSNSDQAAQLVQELVAQLDENDPQIAGDLLRLNALRALQRDQAAAYFAKVANSWDALRGLHVSDEAVEAEVLKCFSGNKIGTLLDLGTGTGRMLELLSERYKNGVGIDSSREMMAVARAKLTAAKIGHAHIRSGDIAHLQDHAATADRVIVHQVLHYFDDPAKVIQAARTTLKPSGALVIVDFAPHELEFLRSNHAHRRLGLSQGQMESWAENAGLRVTKFKDFPSENGSDGLTVCLWVLEETGA